MTERLTGERGVEFGDEFLRVLSQSQGIFSSFTFIPCFLESLTHCCLHSKQMASVLHLAFPARLPRGAGKRLHPPFHSLDA